MSSDSIDTAAVYSTLLTIVVVDRRLLRRYPGMMVRRVLWIASLAACARAPVVPKQPGVYELHSYARNFIPFGAGQAQNGERAKARWFAVTEAVSGAISAGTWLYLVDRYGLSSREVPVRDAPRVRDLEGLEIGSGITFLGLATWGVIDSLVHFEQLTVVPAIVPEGAGLAVSWSR